MTIVLIGQAAYMAEQDWFMCATDGMAVSVLETGFTAPSRLQKMDLEGFEKVLLSAGSVISM